MSALHLTPDGGRATRMFVLVLQSQSPAYTSFASSRAFSLSHSLFLSFSLSYNALFMYLPYSASYSSILAFCFLVCVYVSFTIVMIYAQKLISLSCCGLLAWFSFSFIVFFPRLIHLVNFFLRKKKRIKTDSFLCFFFSSRIIKM